MFERKVECNEFVKRQTKDSGYSHFTGTWDDLADIASMLMSPDYADFKKAGYKKGVVLLEIPKAWLHQFYSATVRITADTKLQVSYGSRRDEEAPYIRISAKNKKKPAVFAEIICYHADVLYEDDDRSTTAEWEIIAIKARSSLEPEPMNPYTMARNFLHLKGGTKADFSAKEFADSIVYWENHCMTTAKTKWYKKVLNIFKGKK